MATVAPMSIRPTRKNPWVADLIIIPIGILDEKADLKPTAEYYTKRRVDWVDGIESADQFQAMS